MNFEEYKKKVFEEDPETKAEYDALEPEFELAREIIKAREEQNLSQQQLADKTGINRVDISRLENGNANPSLKTLKRLAAGLNKRVSIQFLPMD